MKQKIKKTKLFLNPFRLNENNLFELFEHFEKQNYLLFIETVDYSFDNLNDFLLLYKNKIITEFKIRFSKTDEEYIELRTTLFYLPIIEFTISDSEIKANMLYLKELVSNKKYYNLYFLKRLCSPVWGIFFLFLAFFIGIFFIMIRIYRPDINPIVINNIHYLLVVYSLIYIFSINLSNINLSQSKSSINIYIKKTIKYYWKLVIIPLIISLISELLKNYSKEIKKFLDSYFK